MAKRGMPGLASGDSRPVLTKGHKQVAHQVLPSRHAREQITGGDPVQRTMGNFAKQAPDSPNGTAGMNINQLPMLQS